MTSPTPPQKGYEEMAKSQIPEIQQGTSLRRTLLSFCPDMPLKNSHGNFKNFHENFKNSHENFKNSHEKFQNFHEKFQNSHENNSLCGKLLFETDKISVNYTKYLLLHIFYHNKARFIRKMF